MWPWFLIGGGLWLALSSQGPATPLADAIADVHLGKTASARQRARRNARIIEQEARSAGGDDRLVAAMIVNAWRESSLNDAVDWGDGGHSIGLFQLNDWGAGQGLSVEYRLDPYINVRTMLQREVFADTKFGKAFQAVWRAPTATAGDVAKAFTVHLERPKDPEGQGNASRDLVAYFWPGAV
jgi:hypothetical protein